MRALLFVVIAALTAVAGFAQGLEYKIHKNITSVKLCTVKPLDLPEDRVGFVNDIWEAPEHYDQNSEVKQLIDSRRKRRFANEFPGRLDKYKQKSEDVRPVIEDDYDGLPIGGAGVPNDNNIAISNEGFVVSVVNSTVTMFDKEGTHLGLRSLSAFVAGALPSLDRTYDPKITFDPIEKKFILVFLQGSLSADSRIIIGFSTSQDPRDDWHFYALNGTPFGGPYWSDYPIIGISKQDLFVTVNILLDNGSWQDDFQQSLIWQVDKISGFNGEDTLYQTLISDINYNDEFIWSICAVQGAPEPDDAEMYFLSVHPGDLSNDRVFLHKVTNAQRSNNTKYEVKPLVADKKYGVPPSAYQPEVGFRLQTNDARVLSAIHYDDQIQFVQTTNVEGHDPSSIYHAILDLPTGNIRANYIMNDTLDYAYPSICYIGREGLTGASAITFSHVSELHFPGTSVAFHNNFDGLESLYSDVVIVKEGENLIDRFVPDSLERWGDYTGIQPKYDEPGVVWLSGSYGKETRFNGVWIGRVNMNTDLQPDLDDSRVLVYPNPVAERMYIRMDIVKATDVTVALYDLKGQKVLDLYEGSVEVGSQSFYFDRSGIRPGLYLIRMMDGDDEIYSAKVAVD